MLDDFKSIGRLADSPSVAVVGATGAVGIELLRCLESRRFPLQELRLYGSPRSAGRMLRFGGGDLPVKVLSENSFAGIDLALFSAGSAVSRHYTPVAIKAGAVVVDNSSAFRMEPEVPLVVPEVNAHTLANHRGIIANPNCVAAIMTVALAPLHRVWPIRRIIAATYQAASGAGTGAMEELRQSTAAYLRGDDYQPRVLPYPYGSICSAITLRWIRIAGTMERRRKLLRKLGASWRPKRCLWVLPASGCRWCVLMRSR